jgi:hypothetical protein
MKKLMMFSMVFLLLGAMAVLAEDKPAGDNPGTDVKAGGGNGGGDNTQHLAGGQGKGGNRAERMTGMIDKLKDIKAKCPDCAEIAGQLLEKIDEIKAMNEQMKELRDIRKRNLDEKKTAWQAKLVELKDKNPERYEALMTKIEAWKKEKEAEKEVKKDEKKGEAPNWDERIEKLSKLNPEAADTLKQLKKLIADAKDFREQLIECVKTEKAEKKEEKKGDK